MHLFNLRSIVQFFLLLAIFAPTNAWGQTSRSPLIPETTLRRHGLTREWYRQIEMDRSRDRIENVTLDGDMLFVQTRRGTINAIHAETGKKLWVQRIGSPELATTAVGASDDVVAAVNGSTMYLFTRFEGKLAWKRSLRNAPGAGPGVGKYFVFIPSVTGTIEAFSISDPEAPAWYFASSGRIMVPPLAKGDTVSWPTDRGLFYVAAADRLSPRFRVEAKKSIVARPAYIEPHLFVGSLDGYVYKVHERSGVIRWRFSTGQAVVERPLAIKDRILVTARHGGLFCIRAESDVGEADLEEGPGAFGEAEGEEIWWAPRVTKILSVSPTRIYGTDKTGRLNVVRYEDGGHLDSLPVHNLDLFVTNDRTDRLYLGATTGVLQCLREQELKKPVAHSTVDAAKDQPVEAKQIGIDEVDKPKPDAKDPFAEDLFGKGGEEKEMEDPFAIEEEGDDEIAPAKPADEDEADPLDDEDPFAQ